ncbi:MAG TPA: hypothetical protein VG076_07480 [Acidimicrobiales bacterium]|nr:hypothetical protein [Acidimicrobiales bacterium]
MSSRWRARRIGMTYTHPSISHLLAADRQARLRAQANTRRRIRRLGRRLANCS